MIEPTRLLAALTLFTTLTTGGSVLAAPRPLDPPGAGELRHALEKLATVGTVLYVAAHPDDENTRLLAYLAGERKVRVAYVSLTRGDGGQNLIGSELGPMLGLVRTHELLAARRLDGAEQVFSRALDFGYSKRADETLRVWGHEAILGDLVEVVRTLRPDVIVTRFNLELPNHGHHTASALLAREAFTAAADPTRFPGGPAPHQALALLENKSPWRFAPGQDLSAYLALDVGTYSPLLGRSFSEIAAASRTMHKSQGFGAAPELGPTLEHFEVTATAPGVSPPTGDPFALVDTRWERYPGTERLRERLAAAASAMSGAAPERVLPALAAVRDELAALPADHPARAPKLAEVEALLVAAAGLVLDPRASAPAIVPGVTSVARASVIARAADGVALHGVTWPDGARADGPGALARGALVKLERALALPATAPWSTPFWLAAPPEAAAAGGPPGRFVAPSRALAIAPEGPLDLPVAFDVSVAGARFEVVRPLRYGEVDRVHGERLRAVEVLPPVSVTPAAPVLMLPQGAAGTLRVRLMAHTDGPSGAVEVAAPAGYRVVPASAPFALAKAGETSELAFTVTPPKGATDPVELAVTARVGGQAVGVRRDAVDHPHIPARTVLSPARVRVVPLALRTGGRRIGYVPGAGDDVAESLRQVGYAVTLLDDAALAAGELDGFAAIVTGIRAYNVNPRLAAHHDRLMRYVERGGTLVVQYVTAARQAPLDGSAIGPAPFEIGSERVTDEAAPMTPVDAAARALTAPNTLSAADAAGWVQERGLYFAKRWDPRYAPLFTLADPGEEPLSGATLVARHGRGAFVYTGLSFFRQLPAGVPGAYRLFANLLALGGRR